nr:DUF2057 domain-containing protein [uncultured Amphritea sp.]
MRFSSTVFYMFSLIFSSSLMADVKLSVGSDISLIAVNGYEVESKSFFDNKKTAILPNGKNQILVKYSTEIKQAGGLEIESTDAHVLVFTAVDQDVQLSAPTIKKVSELRQFNRGDTWILKDSAGNSITYLSQTLVKDGFQINRNYEQELSKLNQSGGAIAIGNSLKLTGFSSESGEINKPFSNEQNNKSGSLNLPETLLRYWYLHADLETRERFKTWVKGK